MAGSRGEPFSDGMSKMKEHLGASSHQDVGKFYDEHYIASGDGAFSEDRTKIVQLLKEFSMPPELGKGMRLLDAGCGNGQFIEYVCDRLDCVGIEVSEVAFLISIKKLDGKSGKAEIHRMSIDEIPDSWFGTFDYVTSLGVIEHTMNPRLCKAILARCLKTGGILLITVPIEFPNCFRYLSGEKNLETNERFATVDEWRDYLGGDEESFEIIGDGETKHLALIYRKREK